jgi:hypothetical protein
MNTLDSLQRLKQMPINRCTTMSAARDFTLLAASATKGGLQNMCRKGVTIRIMTPQFAESTKLSFFKAQIVS